MCLPARDYILDVFLKDLETSMFPWLAFLIFISILSSAIVCALAFFSHIVFNYKSAKSKSSEEVKLVGEQTDISKIFR